MFFGGMQCIIVLSSVICWNMFEFTSTVTHHIVAVINEQGLNLLNILPFIINIRSTHDRDFQRDKISSRNVESQLTNTISDDHTILRVICVWIL